MRVCINKSTGKLIESQSGGNTQAHLDTLKQNALNAGHSEADIEVKFVTDAEYQAILDSMKPIPTEKQLYEIAIKAKEAEILRRMAIAEIKVEKL